MENFPEEIHDGFVTDCWSRVEEDRARARSYCLTNHA